MNNKIIFYIWINFNYTSFDLKYCQINASVDNTEICMSLRCFK